MDVTLMAAMFILFSFAKVFCYCWKIKFILKMFKDPTYMKRKSQSGGWWQRIKIPLTLVVVPGGLMSFILVDAFQPLLVYLYFNRFMTPGQQVSLAGFACIFIILLKNVHNLFHFIAKLFKKCFKSQVLRSYEEHYEYLKYFGSHRILSPHIKLGYPKERKIIGLDFINYYVISYN